MYRRRQNCVHAFRRQSECIGNHSANTRMQNLIKFSSVFFVRQIFVCCARMKEIGDLFDQNVYGFKNKYVIGMIGRCQHLQ